MNSSNNATQRYFKHAALALILSSSLLVSATETQLEIPAQPLDKALNALAKQSGERIVFSTDLTEKIVAPAVKGKLTTQQALEKLLTGSGLVLQATGTNGYTVVKQAPVKTAPVNTVNLKPKTPETISPQEEEVAMPEVSVTTMVGTKRRQTLQEAVQSVALFETKDVAGMTDAFDALVRIPNVTNISSASVLPTIRGLDANGTASGGGGAVTGSHPRMSTYVDGIAKSYSASPDGLASLWDMQQLEIYRGSQSTQLGRNSMAGAIVLTSKDPVFKDEYAASVGARSDKTTYTTAFMANKKVNDDLAIRLTGEGSRGLDFMDYALQDPAMDSDDQREAGRQKYSQFRLKALYAPIANPDLTVKLTVNSERAARRYGATVNLNSGGKFLTTSPFNYSYSNIFNNASSLEIGYAFNNAWRLDNILGYQRAENTFGPPPNGTPATYLDFSFNTREISLESRLSYASPTSRTSAVLGTFLMNRDRTDFGKPGTSFDLSADDKSTTRSIFGDAKIELASKWDLLLGGRLEQEKQKRDFTGFGGFFAFNIDEKANVFLPKAGLSYHLTDDTTLSALAYQGYTAGGGGVSFTTATPYRFTKEFSDTAEFVWRSQWYNRRITTNANLFITRLKDAQLFGIGPGGIGDSTIVNAEKVQTHGLELELAYDPDTKNRGFVSVGLLDSDIKDFGDALNNANNGNQLQAAPHLTGRIGGRTEVLPNLTLGGDIQYTGARYSDYQNTAVDKLESFYLANLNMRYQYQKVVLNAYVNNLFDEFTYYAKSTASNNAQVMAPRTVGANVVVNF